MDTNQHQSPRKHRRPPTPSDRRTLGQVEASWLFRRGDDTVRIVRVGCPELGPRLLVQGPGASHLVHQFDDMMQCAIHQSEIERRLVARRFRLDQLKVGSGS